MNWARIWASAAAALAFFLSMIFLVWSTLCWLLLHMSMLQAAFILFLSFLLLGALLVLIAMALKPAPQQRNGLSDLPLDALKLAVDPEDLEVVQKFCERRPLLGVALAAALGFVSGRKQTF